MSKFIEYTEKNYSPKVPKEGLVPRDKEKLALSDGATIVIVGGGIAGSSLARELLIIASEENICIEVNLINSNTCNYCGGLITNLAEKTLQEMYKLSVPSELILKEIDTCIYLTHEGSVEVDLKTKMIATLRTSKFGLQGFDDSIKSRVTEGLGPHVAAMLKIFEPTIVTKIRAPEKDQNQWQVQLSRRDHDHQPIVIAGDVLVMAAGFKSLNRPMMGKFAEQTGYSIPPLMSASVTEISTDQAITNKITDQIVIIDNIVPNAVVAIIPKSEHWITITSLGKKLTFDDIDLLFRAEALKKYLDLPYASDYLRCKMICPANVFTGHSKKFYGDGWVAIGDLTGYGRVLKDGYFASFLESHLVARTIFYQGATAANFKKYYHKHLKKFTLDNHFGMSLFKFNLWLGKFPLFRKILLAVGQAEQKRDPSGSFMHSSIRALTTGDLSYRLITFFFVMGFLNLFTRPRELLKIIRKM